MENGGDIYVRLRGSNAGDSNSVAKSAKKAHSRHHERTPTHVTLSLF